MNWTPVSEFAPFDGEYVLAYAVSDLWGQYVVAAWYAPSEKWIARDYGEFVEPTHIMRLEPPQFDPQPRSTHA